MASVVFQNAIASTFKGDLDWETASLYARLCMTLTTADSNHDADTVNDLSLDETNDTGYPAGGVEVTGGAVSVDDTDNEMEWTSDDWVFSGLNGDGSRDFQGALLVKHVDGGTGDIPIIFVDFTSDVVKEATQVTVPPDAAEGFFNVGQPT